MAQLCTQVELTTTLLRNGTSASISKPYLNRDQAEVIRHLRIMSETSCFLEDRVVQRTGGHAESIYSGFTPLGYVQDALMRAGRGRGGAVYMRAEDNFIM